MEQMPKALYIPPPLNQADIPETGAEVTIKEVRVVTEQWTGIGTVHYGLGLTVDYEGESYSQIFSMDDEVLTGSIGRLLVSAGIEDTDVEGFDKKIKALISRKVRVVKRQGKIYWYP